MSETTNKKRVMALSSLRRRAAAGDIDAQASLGRALALGELGKPDHVAAWVALSRAASAGHAAARSDLAHLEANISPEDQIAAEAALKDAEDPAVS
jgi:TPR repeat protein